MKKLRFNLAVLVCALAVLVLPLFSACTQKDSGETDSEEKVYCTATIDDDFTDDCVIVVLQSSISGVNKVHKPEFFKGVDVESIEDLTWRENNFEVGENFRQILKINLKTHSKQNVLDAVAALEKLRGIYSASPNMPLSPDV